MSSEHVLKMAEEGTVLGSDETHTAEFAGTTWHVKAAIGNSAGLVLVMSTDAGSVPVTDVLRALTRSMAAFVVGINGVSDASMRRVFLDLINMEIDMAIHTFETAKAARGKPS